MPVDVARDAQGGKSFFAHPTGIADAAPSGFDSLRDKVLHGFGLASVVQRFLGAIEAYVASIPAGPDPKTIQLLNQ